ncbi:hypothetical protein [Flavobacterium sp. JP2137]|uniref:hypothetical protein n=1 Tax=Flavobacterium sp. JP2137 TaxID=3414510 RepID=UPI003D2FA631
MANSNNVYGTERSGQPSISDWVNQQDHANYRVRQEKQQQEQLEQHRKDKLLARDEKLRERLLSNLPKNTDTGSGSLNEFQGKIIMQAVNRKGEIYNALRNGNISDSERVKLEIENSNLDNLSSNLTTATGNFTKLIDDYKKGIDGGGFFKNPDFEKKVLSGFESYLGGLDENGFPLVGFRDNDSDGKIDLMPWDNLQQGLGVWDFQPKLNYDKVVSDAAKAMGTVENQDVNGYTTTTTKGVPIKNAQAMANSLIYGSDGEVTPFAKSRLRELGYDYTKPPEDAIKAIEKDITERIVMSKDQSSKKDVNHSASISRERLNFDKSKDARDSAEKSKDKASTGEAVDPSVNTWGKTNIEKIGNNSKSVPVSGKVKIPAISTKDSTITDATIDNYTYSKDGKLMVDVSYLDGKKTSNVFGDDGEMKTVVTDKAKKVITVSKETESRIAAQLGISVSEMKERAGFKQNSKTDNLPNLNDLPDL